MSFVRLFDDTSVGWQLRGQYAIWTGAGRDSRFDYVLLERLGKRVARIAYSDGGPVFHRIAGGTAFTIEGLMGYWVSYDSDAMWVDVPTDQGQFCMLAIGGAAGKPGAAEVSSTCPRCGSKLTPKPYEIPPLGFSGFLQQAAVWTAEFNAVASLRTCGECAALHPETAMHSSKTGLAAHEGAGV